MRLPSFFLLLLVTFACGGGGAGGPVVPPPPETWRSALFPSDWTPGTEDEEGRFLPDVSHAGYHHGEAALPALDGWRVVDVVASGGADVTGRVDATAAFQAALDEPPPVVVQVPAGTYRIDGLLVATHAQVVLRGEGAAKSRLFFTRHEGMTGRAHLTFRGALTNVAETPLVVDAAARSFEVRVADAAAFAPGDDVALGCVVTDAFLAEHGMEGTWKAFNGSWQVFLRRRVAAVDTESVPHRILFEAPIRYPVKVRDRASLRKETGFLSEVGVRDLGLANAVGWDEAWANTRVHVLAFVGVKDAFAERVESFVPPVAPEDGNGAGAHLQSGGIHVQQSKRVTVAECRMARAQHRGGGGCGYLFEILQSTDVLTRDCEGTAGRHNFIQNWGFGTTGCVWLRCRSSGGFAVSTQRFPSIGQVGFSEYHHSLATANLVDCCVVDDGWAAENRGSWSTGAGLTSTRCMFWNVRGAGRIRSRQFAWGYVIGTRGDLEVDTSMGGNRAAGSAPEDFTEGLGRGASLRPPSLYEAQLAKRLGR